MPFSWFTAFLCFNHMWWCWGLNRRDRMKAWAASLIGISQAVCNGKTDQKHIGINQNGRMNQTHLILWASWSSIISLSEIFWFWGAKQSSSGITNLARFFPLAEALFAWDELSSHHLWWSPCRAPKHVPLYPIWRRCTMINYVDRVGVLVFSGWEEKRI